MAVNLKNLAIIAAVSLAMIALANNNRTIRRLVR